MNPFSPHNQRSEEMWKFISKNVDFNDKRVLDLGCGYGDFSFYAWMEGAISVLSVDNNGDILIYAIETRAKYFQGSLILFTHFDVEKIWGTFNKPVVDIAMCFSVLPYLKDHEAFLRNVREHCEVLLLEVQYYGDGPGPAWLRTDEDMKDLLARVGWNEYRIIGGTTVEERNTYRPIWLCK